MSIQRYGLEAASRFRLNIRLHDMRAQAAASRLRTLGVIGLSLASIGAILMIWMDRVKQELLRQESSYTQGAEEGALGGAPYSHTDFRGDLIGYAKNSIALNSVRPENRVALLTLANAGTILHRGSDFSGDTPDYVKAFDVIDNDSAALIAFRELVLYATPAGKIYGLCGLYLKRSSSFSLARAHLIQSPPSLVLFKSSYDVIEERDARKLAERPEDICLKLRRVAQKVTSQPAAPADGWRSHIAKGKERDGLTGLAG